jgi:hypothetical protein
MRRDNKQKHNVLSDLEGWCMLRNGMPQINVTQGAEVSPQTVGQRRSETLRDAPRADLRLDAQQRVVQPAFVVHRALVASHEWVECAN